jgi:putative CocE/NonD family hydrolase
MRIEMPLAVLLAVAVTTCGWTQTPASFSIPMAARSDPTALEAAIPGLACQALSTTADNTAEERELRFRFLFSCGRYAQALEAMADRSRRRSSPAGESVEPWLRLELHARALGLVAREHIPYEDAFRSVLAEKFATLDDRAAVDSAWMLGLPPATARANLDRQLRQYANRDSLTQAQLLDILFWHSAWQAVQAFAPSLDAAVARDDAKRFAIDRGVPIRTQQGATLTADVVRPRRLTGPQPTALRFTIYSDPAFNLKSAKDAAARGYVGVLASARGKNLSTDKIVPWETEAQDTWAVIDWISHQPWSDGQVGMYGNSYDAFAQWAAAKHPHPALKTIVPSGASAPGNGLPMQNNVIQTENYGWPLQVTSDRFMGDPALHDWSRWSSLMEKWFDSGRPLRAIDAIDGTPNEILQRQMRHPSFDAYWQAMQPYGNEFARIRIPVLSVTGYFDPAGAPAVHYLIEHYRHDPRAEHFLVIGPWSHGDNLLAWKNAVVNGYTVDPAANIDTEALVFQWFDHVLRGGPRPPLLKDRINYEVMGTDAWGHAPSIEKMSDRILRLYLSARPVGGRFALSPRIPLTDGFVEQTVDLADRKTRINLYPGTAWLDTPDDATQIRYVSEPFEHAVCVCGLIKGELQVLIDRKDFDFTWALYEATPEGRYFNLSYYLGRASYAVDPKSRKLLSPMKVSTLPFSQSPLVARQLSVGSRLLLLLTVNKNPHAQVNYGTGKDVSDESVADAGRPLRVQWHEASYIDVPLRDAAAAAPMK